MGKRKRLYRYGRWMIFYRGGFGLQRTCHRPRELGSWSSKLKLKSGMLTFSLFNFCSSSWTPKNQPTGKTFCRRGTMHGEEGARESWQGPRQRTQSCVFGFEWNRQFSDRKPDMWDALCGVFRVACLLFVFSIGRLAVPTQDMDLRQKATLPHWQHST